RASGTSARLHDTAGRGCLRADGWVKNPSRASILAPMDLDELRHNWEVFGQTDPLWAVLTSPAKRGNRWNLEDFLAEGRHEVEVLRDYLTTLPLRLKWRRALDFGCGVGRITQALAPHFKEVDGVDISASMIEHARRLNRYGGRCRYHLNTV